MDIDLELSKTRPGSNTELTPPPDIEVDAIELRLREERLMAQMFGGVPQPVQLDHYLLLETLGQGGMGVVYAAYDRTLDRKVALKRLHALGDAQMQRRLIREAKAMAQLAHPNVVQVYEIGTSEQTPFIVMEYVEGQTLRDWLASAERALEDILEVFRAAGRGLLAAHERGLVHRDFKPDNVMVRADGRVLVMDFGLARGDFRSPNTDDRAQIQPDTELLVSMTHTRGLVGSPGYMAPEQLAGSEATHAADQFAFCISLWEALCGERPFPGPTLALLAKQTRAGTLPSPDPGRMPAWIRTILARGLAPNPEARFESMQTLLAALATAPQQRWRKWGLAAFLVAGSAGALWGLSHRPTAPSCATMETHLVGLWDDERRVELRAAFVATGQDYAAQSFVTVEARIDTYTREWVAARVAACEASVNGEQSALALDLRMACLDRDLIYLRDTLEVFATAEPSVIERAVRAVQGLPRLEQCADLDALRAEHPLPDDLDSVAEIRTLEAQLATAAALRNAGNHARALALSEATLRSTEALAYTPLETRALVELAATQGDSGAHERALSTWKRAYPLALEQRMMPTASQIATRVIWLLGDPLERHAEGRSWALHAEALAHAAGGRAMTNYLEAVGNLAEAESNYAEARELLTRVLALREAERDPDTLLISDALNNLGILEDSDGDYDEARDVHLRALDLRERTLGPRHPLVASSLNNLGMVEYHAGNYESAFTLLQRALSIREAALSPDHPDLAGSHNNLGLVLDALIRPEQAGPHYLRALEIWREAKGRAHPLVANPLINLGILAQNRGDDEAAQAHLDEALAILESQLGPEHPELAVVLSNLGNLALARERFEQAQAHHARALELWERAHGPEHPYVGIARINLGEVALARGDYAGARELFEGGRQVLEASFGPENPDLAYAHTGLGRALTELGEYEAGLRELERALVLREANPTPREALDTTREALAHALRLAPPALRDRKGADADR